MFSQVAPALERSQGGLGIGLSLVRGLVEMHGGTVEARSGGLGQGSEFIVRLPVVEVPVQQVRRNRAESARSPGAGRSAASWWWTTTGTPPTAWRMMLRLMGHDIQTAHDGLEAVEAAATFRPDVVLLDIGMPKMNGYEAARHIREQPWGKGMVLVALTGWGQEEDKRRSIEAGFDHHLTKPVDPDCLDKAAGDSRRAWAKLKATAHVGGTRPDPRRSVVAETRCCVGSGTALATGSSRSNLQTAGPAP